MTAGTARFTIHSENPASKIPAAFDEKKPIHNNDAEPRAPSSAIVRKGVRKIKRYVAEMLRKPSIIPVSTW